MWFNQRENNHLYINLKNGKSASRICFVTFRQRNHCFIETLISSHGPHGQFCTTMSAYTQEMASTENTHTYYMNIHIDLFTFLKSATRVGKLFPHPMGICRAHTEPKCHARQKTWIAKFREFLINSWSTTPVDCMLESVQAHAFASVLSNGI